MFASIPSVMLQNGVGDVAVREYLYGAVVASQLLLGEDVGVVAMIVAFHA